MTWDGLKTDPENGVVMNLNTAYLDAKASTIFIPSIRRT
ncbi:hypothetical protein ID866_3536 [Astraeus odoratus]|nr:hypothetical protein ID866_3536 [Astraeus odoratus]